jgi:putative heme iron utilization protein
VTRHAGPPPDPDRPPVPEPSYAERARTLLALGRTGSLATLSRRHPGYPFASLMPYALDGEGRPLFLISRLAIHTQNLEADPQASLLVAEGGAGDPLAAARVTVMGEVAPVPAPDRAPTRAAYLARHPNAAYWVDFEDFAFHRLEVTEVYFVGGFAAMDWVDAVAFRTARPDPLAEAAPGILEHMNRDHPDALLTFARVLGGTPADHATMIAVDRLGFRLRVRFGDRLHGTRVAFPREVRTPDEVRAVLIEMLRSARADATS